MTSRARLRQAIAGAAAALMATTGVLTLGAAQSAPSAAAATTPRVDLGVLVVGDGNPWTQAIQQQLKSEGVPVKVVDLSDGSRPTIDSSFLAGTTSDGTPEAHYQGVVLGNDAPSQLSGAELNALASYETKFSVRQVDAYTYPNANVGLNPPDYGGSLDGSTATVTAAAKTDGFGYLKGSFNFQGTAGGSQSYGYLAQPMAATATASFTPYLTAPIPGKSGSGTLAGVYQNSGREQLVVGFGYNNFQLQYRYLAHGIADWVTRGVHLGYWRNYLTTDSDDEFNADAEWSQQGKCTPGDSSCAPGTPATTPSRMNAADVAYAVNWQNSHNYKLELLYNGFPSASGRFNVNGKDPLLTAFKPVASNFWWVNHTYTHQWLGCLQDFSVTPWKCQTDASGNTQWVDTATISGEITKNIQWAQQNGIPIQKDELAPGEYSGLRILPQQPVDNPNLVQAIASNGIKWVPLDASREPAMRPIGSALGVPRHPIDVFYNVSNKADEVSEYNWIYDSAADGGSGLCTQAGTQCLAPLDLNTGWDSWILPRQITTMLTSAVQNDPRPFMFHQSNLTGDRLLYPVVNGVLSAYNSVFAGNTPIVNQRLSAAGAALHSQDQWAQASSTVSGYIQGGTVKITGPSGTSVPVTAPSGTRVGTATGATFGSAYGGEQSAYTTLGSGPLTLVLKAAPYPGSSGSTATTAATTPDTKSTSTINAAVNPTAVPGGKLGTAVINATSGPAAVSGPQSGGK